MNSDLRVFSEVIRSDLQITESGEKKPMAIKTKRVSSVPIYSYSFLLVHRYTAISKASG